MPKRPDLSTSLRKAAGSRPTYAGAGASASERPCVVGCAAQPGRHGVTDGARAGDRAGPTEAAGARPALDASCDLRRGVQHALRPRGPAGDRAGDAEAWQWRNVAVAVARQDGLWASTRGERGGEAGADRYRLARDARRSVGPAPHQRPVADLSGGHSQRRDRARRAGSGEKHHAVAPRRAGACLDGRWHRPPPETRPGHAARDRRLGVACGPSRRCASPPASGRRRP